ncbi:BMC domain-containing protein [Paenibacillus dendritiformis]|uniref:BMC domain-containing protein n=3 Tax=Paenibacillus dendritiformis TaxID=130049 RepID=UPI001C267212|nr:BMC domain-containing protein [Paenibacillus dendritiformis]
MTYDAIGVIEARYFATALEMTDAMSKAAQVEWLASEKALGGRLVTIIIGGDVANVKAAVEAAKAVCAGKAVNPLAHAAVILKPHAEIMKFIMPRQAGEEERPGAAGSGAAGAWDAGKAAAETALDAGKASSSDPAVSEAKANTGQAADADAETGAPAGTKTPSTRKSSRPAAAEKNKMKEEQ